MRSYLVVNLDDTVREAPHGLQAEWHVPMSVGNERYTLADELRDHTDDEIVDGPFVKERSDDLAAAHHPDMFSRFGSESLGEVANWFIYKLDAGRKRLRRWLA
jgi:hypothetical protein